MRNFSNCSYIFSMLRSSMYNNIMLIETIANGNMALGDQRRPWSL